MQNQRWAVFGLFVFTIVWPPVFGFWQADPNSPAYMKVFLGPTAASWAQAMGTVIAFLMTFSVAVTENDRERARRQEVQRETIVRTRRLARRLASIADERMRASLQAFDQDPSKVPPAGWALTQRALEADLSTMKTFNLHDLEEVKPMQTFALVIGLMHSAFDVLTPLAEGTLHKRINTQQQFAHAKAAMAQLQAEISNLASRLNAQLDALDAAVETKAKPRRIRLAKARGIESSADQAG